MAKGQYGLAKFAENWIIDRFDPGFGIYTMDIKNDIEQQLQAHSVVLYMKGVPENTNCSYSGRIVDLLQYTGVEYKAINVLQSDRLRREIKMHAGVRTLPLLFVNAKYIGGADDVRQLFESGQLDDLFTSQNIPLNPKLDRIAPDLNDVTKDQLKNCSKAG